MNSIVRLKAKYLIETLGYKELKDEIKCADGRLKEFLSSDLYPLPSRVSKRVELLFIEVVTDEKLMELSMKEHGSIKNYDNDNLKDLKGGYRKSGAGGNKNNSWTANVSEDYL